MLKQRISKLVLYSLLFICLLTPIITISLPMKTLNTSSEATRTGRSDNTRAAAATANTWTNKTNPSGDKPSARSYHSMTYDSTHDRTILFSGDDGTLVDDDTWIYNYADNSWTNMTNPSGDKPSARYYHSMAYDSTHDRIILFGGDDDYKYFIFSIFSISFLTPSNGFVAFNLRDAITISRYPN